MKQQPIKNRYDTPFINHFRGKAQGRVHYSTNVRKGADTVEITIEFPSYGTTARMELNEDQTVQFMTILEKSLEALKTQEGNESGSQ